jgi:hypothetical protein
MIVAKRFPEKHHPLSLGLNLHFCLLWDGFGDQAFPILFLKSFTLNFERLVIEIWGGIEPSILFMVRVFR